MGTDYVYCQYCVYCDRKIERKVNVFSRDNYQWFHVHSGLIECSPTAASPCRRFR